MDGTDPGVDQDSIKRRIIELQLEHRDLDIAIEELASRIARVGPQPGGPEGPGGLDELGLRRLKKRKLMIKDALTRLQMRLVPDIPA